MDSPSPPHDHGQFASPEIAAAWTAEIDRRIAAYERGELQATEAVAAVERMRGFLADHRARVPICGRAQSTNPQNSANAPGSGTEANEETNIAD